MQYTAEELLGMVLNYSRGLAQDFAGERVCGSRHLYMGHSSSGNVICIFFSPWTEQPIKDAVITVPAFFNQAERRAVLQAAQLAGLKVLQLINDNTAVALNYGVFRRKDIDNTAKVPMFNVGHRRPLIIAVFLTACCWFPFRMWCSMIWGQAAPRRPSSPIRRWNLKSLAPSPSYKSEVLGEYLRHRWMAHSHTWLALLS